jgi:hypothetical protein
MPKIAPAKPNVESGREKKEQSGAVAQNQESRGASDAPAADSSPKPSLLTTTQKLAIAQVTHHNYYGSRNNTPPPHRRFPLQLLWCLCASLATGIASDSRLTASYAAWSSFFDVASLNAPAQSIPLLLEFMRVPSSLEFNCSQVNGNGVIPPTFPLNNRLSSLLAIEVPVSAVPADPCVSFLRPRSLCAE